MHEFLYGLKRILTFMERIMRLRKIIHPLILMTLIVLFTTGAMAEYTVDSFSPFMATPEPEQGQFDQGSKEQMTLATPIPAAKRISLPNLSNYLGVTGKYQEHYFEYGNYVADAHLFATTQTDKISKYLADCVERGYQWSFDQYFSNLDAYRITGGGYTAYLILDFGNQILLLTEHGMEMDAEAKIEPYQRKSLVLTLNGTNYILQQTDETVLEKRIYSPPSYLGTSNSFVVNDVVEAAKYAYYHAHGSGIAFSSSSSVGYVELGIPSFANAGEAFTMTRDSNPDNLSFVLESGDLYPKVDIEQYGNVLYDVYEGLIDDQDYLKVTIIDCEKAYAESMTGYFNPYTHITYNENHNYISCQGKFEGRFFQGTIKISGTFYYYNDQ